MSKKTYSGNEVEVYINGELVPVLSQLTMDDDYGLQPLSGVGDGHVQEWVPGQFTHRATIAKALFKPESLFASRIIPENGDVIMQGLEYDVEIFFKEGGMGRKLENAKCGTNSVRVRMHGILEVDATFVGRDASGVLAA